MTFSLPLIIVPDEDRYPICDCCQLEVGYLMESGLCPICDEELNRSAS